MQDDKNQQEKDQNLRENGGAKNPFNTTSQPGESNDEGSAEEADAEAEQQRKEALTERD